MNLDRFLADIERGGNLFVGFVLKAAHGEDPLPHRGHIQDNLFEVVFKGSRILTVLGFRGSLRVVLHDVLLIDILDHVMLAIVKEDMFGCGEEVAESRLLITQAVPVFPQTDECLLYNLFCKVRISAGEAQGETIDMAAIRVVQLLKLPLAGGFSIIAEYAHSIRMTVEMGTSPNRGVIF